MSSRLHSAKEMFFDVGATDFEITPVYRRGFNTVSIHAYNSVLTSFI